MSLVETLRNAKPSELRCRIVEGHPVDPDALAGWAYRGTSLGLPRFVEKLTWKTFQKTFYRAPASGRLLGWNVRLEQDGLDAPSRPKRRRGVPVTTWHYEVISPDGVRAPRGFDRGLIIDYGRAKNPLYDTIRIAKDPLVAVEPGNPDLLLGVTYLTLGPLCVETPTYFLLEREHPLDFVPDMVSRPPWLKGPPALLGFERRWAELLFDALLGAGAGVPRMAELDRDTFWRALGTAAPPYFGPGLRATVHGLTFLPLTLPGFRRPLFALSEDARRAYVERLGEDPRVTVRQMLATLKVMACFALFEDEGARRRLGGAGVVAPATARESALPLEAAPAAPGFESSPGGAP